MIASDALTALLAEFAREPAEQKGAFVFSHPALLARSALDALATSASSGATASALSQLSTLRDNIDGGAIYPLGLGPIETAWQALGRGEISREEAARRSTVPEVVNPLTYPYVRALSGYALNLANKNWSDALELQTLILAACEVAEATPEALLSRTRVSMDYISIATPALINAPDGRIYRRAMDAGAWAADRPERLTLWPPGELAFRLGVLNLDPYFLGGDVINYARSLNAWQSRLYQLLGPAAAAIPGADLAMPEPAEALATAVAQLRIAVATETVDALPAAQKALVQALSLQSALFGTANETEIGAVGKLLLASADPQTDPVLFLTALSTALRGNAIERAEAERRILTLPSPEDLLAHSSPQRSVQAVLDALLLLVELNSAQGLAFVERYRDFIAAQAGAAAQRQFWDRETALFVTETAVAVDGVVSPADLMPLIARAQREQGEQNARTELDRTVAAFPQFAAAHVDALEYLRYMLVQGMAKNAIDAGNWAEAIVNDGLAMSYCLRRHFDDEALTCATRIDDLASHGGPGVVASLAVVLISCALRLEAALGDVGLRLTQSICRKAFVDSIAQGNVELNVYCTLVLGGVGAQFSAAVRAQREVRPGDDVEAASLLAEICEIERAIGPQFETLKEEELLLSSFTEAGQREDGAQPAERLRNLQRAFDTRVEHLLAAGATERLSTDELRAALGDVKAALDDRTVLLHYYLGATPDGRCAVNVLLVTNESVESAVVPQNFPASLVKADLGSGLVAYMPPIAVSVGDLRSKVVAFPGARLVDRDGGDALTADLRTLLGPFVERLAELRTAGKTYLTIVPHGPLHFYPWSLLGGPDHPLATDWTITVAPSLGFLLARTETPPSPPKTERAVLGLSFAQPNRLHLTPIPSSVLEAKSVAATLKVDPLLDDAATKTAALGALERCRSVHISTHGRHAAAAPGFQTIFFADDGTDAAGRLFAHEILSLDLRGLELLTLSACETALGRYDLGDNLRGLPSAFFLVGVQTIVATLWPVDPEPSRAFFEAFYTESQGGAAHRDAFALAQRTTRGAYPKFRDWGAFYLMGHGS